MLRVKTERESLAKMLGYEQKDALLATGCKIKAAAGGGDGAWFGAVVVWTFLPP